MEKINIASFANNAYHEKIKKKHKNETLLYLVMATVAIILYILKIISILL